MLYVEILIVACLILLNGVLAMSEMAMVSSRKARLEQMAANGNRGAKAALETIADPGSFLSTVQIGITLVGITAGAFSGASLGDDLGDWLEQFAAIAAYSDVIATGLIVLVITYLSLIVGELVPKRIALSNPEFIATRVARPMRALAKFATPGVWLLKHSSDFVLRVLGLTKARDNAVTEEEVKSLIAEGTKTGVFAPQEREMIEGVLRLADRSARAIMTPRAEVVWIDRAADRDELNDVLASRRHSCLLVCDTTVDKPVGVIYTKTMLHAAVMQGNIDISALMEPVPRVEDQTLVFKLMDRFKREKVHFAVVVDQYGTTEGIVTLTDILESIAGEMPERGDDTTPLMQSRADGSWLVDASLLIDEFEAKLGVRNMSASDEFHTVAGLVLECLGRVPQEGERFEHKGFRFEVVDMDGRRVDKLLVSKLPESDGDINND